MVDFDRFIHTYQSKHTAYYPFLICGSAMLPYLFFHEMDIAKLEMLKSE